MKALGPPKQMNNILHTWNWVRISYLQDLWILMINVKPERLLYDGFMAFLKACRIFFFMPCWPWRRMNWLVIRPLLVEEVPPSSYETQMTVAYALNLCIYWNYLVVKCSLLVGYGIFFALICFPFFVWGLLGSQDHLERRSAQAR